MTYTTVPIQACKVNLHHHNRTGRTPDGAYVFCRMIRQGTDMLQLRNRSIRFFPLTFLFFLSLISVTVSGKLWIQISVCYLTEIKTCQKQVFCDESHESATLVFSIFFFFLSLHKASRRKPDIPIMHKAVVSTLSSPIFGTYFLIVSIALSIGLSGDTAPL